MSVCVCVCDYERVYLQVCDWVWVRKREYGCSPSICIWECACDCTCVGAHKCVAGLIVYESKWICVSGQWVCMSMKGCVHVRLSDYMWVY